MRALSVDQQAPSSPKIELKVVLGGIYLCLGVLCWSGSTVVYKFLSESFPPYLVLAMRYILATLILGSFWIYSKGYKDQLNRKTVLILVILGLFGIAFHNLSIFLGVKYTSANMGAIIMATAPIIAQFLAVPVLKRRVSKEGIGWSVLSLLGIVIVIGIGGTEPNWIGLLWLFGSAFSLAFFNVYAAKLMQEQSVTPKTLTCTTISIATFPFVPLLLIDFGSITLLDTVTVFIVFWLSVLYLVLIGNIIGRSLYNIGVQKAGSSVATIIMNLGPIFTTILAFFFLGEIPTIGLIIGGSLVIVGVIGIIRTENREQRDQNTDLTVVERKKI
ncbi:MAG: DMT family transporter [Candidatus Hodarchaeota archaeon]